MGAHTKRLLTTRDVKIIFFQNESIRFGLFVFKKKLKVLLFLFVEVKNKSEIVLFYFVS
jgi:hypothetical protein